MAARDQWERDAREPDRLRNAVLRHTSGPGVMLEYVSVADPFTLEELERRASRAVVSLAARVGKARLIDNVLLGIEIEDVT
jgi:pantoate--beta-alanine ligase